MRKLCIVHLLNSNKFAGAENVACQIIEGTKDSYDCFYVSPAGTIQKTLEDKKINFYPIKSMNIFEIKKMIKVLKPTIIHAHDFRASIISALSTSKIPIISHLHNNSPWLKNYGIYSWVYLISTIKYKKILIVSNSIKQEYVFGRWIKSKILMIGNPINIKYIQEKANQSNIKKAYDIIFIGRFMPEKDPIKFIEIISELVKTKQLKNLNCVMIGEGKLKKDCKQLIYNLNLKNNIDMVGFLDNPYIYLKNSKLLCMTSKWEGFGLVAIEALALGVPVVAKPVGGLINIVDSKCGKLCNSNKDYIIELKKLLLNDNYRINKGKEAIIKSKELNNYNSYIKIIKQLYKKLIIREE
ncbi:MAG: hypothetical protein ATN32_03560 [Candidatus Epulonipiscium fishelsonii]|nr:MAG: hypothetical protein ATN32_03560 [Epulopiscium sp. AS2M-Bin002]